MCSSGVMSWAVTKTSRTESGISLMSCDGAVLGDLLHQRLGVEPFGLGDLLEDRVHLDQDVLVHHLAHEGDREERLDAGGGVGDDGDGPGRRDGGDGGVADRLGARTVVDGPLEVGERAAHLGQLRGRHLPFVVDELHHLLAQGRRPRRSCRGCRA